MKEYTEEYKKLSSGQVIKETRCVSPENGKLYAKTTLCYNDEGIVYKITDWVQNKDKSITYSSRIIPHLNCFGKLNLR
ncbi:hypothetical protein [Tenacibaculum retecalamus]|uniref:hypothetical protein n=1 Tax=Tenacibaculum retecalamus TaxID=3018315 RepID=UPI0023D94BF4|nr:hypothetical protein [Tenacibaculum retecalamus]WBX72003.1 hypothetical protein PG912_04325 [Tenacibaculum retecalamus]